MNDAVQDNRILRINSNDDVIVALKDLSRNDSVNIKGEQIEIKENIPAKHKFASKDFNKGDEVHQYGVLVGRTLCQIPKGGLIHTGNLAHAVDSFEMKDQNFTWSSPDINRWQGKTFEGFHRSDSKVGTANNWLVIPLVFCENHNLNTIKNALIKELGFARPESYTLQTRKLVELVKEGKSSEEILKWQQEEIPVDSVNDKVFPYVDGIKFLLHEGGCGGTPHDARELCALFAGYINHPNVAGATVLSLGCQNAQPAILREEIQKRNPDFDKPLFILEQQQEGTEKQLIQEALKQTIVGLMEANHCRRKSAPLSSLIMGVECGGSDGFSGISANPAIGQASDFLVALGGSVILAEFPELCGVEQSILGRCRNSETAEKFVKLLKQYESWAEAVGARFDLNPSAGNLREGIVTDAMKSAGAAKKGGTSGVMDVLDYTESLTRKGLNLLCTPGGDVESTTAIAGSGAQVILFSSGLGTPTGNPVAQVIKISTNTQLAEKMPDIIDLDAGGIITGADNLETMGSKILDYVIEIAGGKQTKAMQLGQDDFIPWKRQISL